MDLKELKQILASLDINPDEIEELASLDINPDEIEDKECAEGFRTLLSTIEELNKENEALKAEYQKLLDEKNLLKNEQIKRMIRGSKKNDGISSKKEKK
jgi:hypothetical protein